MGKIKIVLYNIILIIMWTDKYKCWPFFIVMPFWVHYTVPISNLGWVITYIYRLPVDFLYYTRQILVFLWKKTQIPPANSLPTLIIHNHWLVHLLQICRPMCYYMANLITRVWNYILLYVTKIFTTWKMFVI